MCGSWRADPNVSVARYSGDPRGGPLSSLSGLTASKSELLHHYRLQLDHGWASPGFLCVLWRAVDATIAPGAHALRGSGLYIWVSIATTGAATNASVCAILLWPGWQLFGRFMS